MSGPDSPTVIVPPVIVPPSGTQPGPSSVRKSGRRLQAFGAGLIAYGLIGIVVFALVAFGVSRPLARVGELTHAVDADIAALVDTMEKTESTVRRMSTSVQGMDDSLGAAQASVTRSSDIATGLSATMLGLRDAMNITIFGTQPLSGLAAGFENAASQLSLLSQDLASISTALGTNRADVIATSESLDELADSVATLTDTVDSGPDLAISDDTLDAVKLGVWAISAWLALFALGCTVLGVYLVVQGSRRVAEAQ